MVTKRNWFIFAFLVVQNLSGMNSSFSAISHKRESGIGKACLGWDYLNNDPFCDAQYFSVFIPKFLRLIKGEICNVRVRLEALNKDLSDSDDGLFDENTDTDLLFDEILSWYHKISEKKDLIEKCLGRLKAQIEDFDRGRSFPLFSLFQEVKAIIDEIIEMENEIKEIENTYF